MENNTPNWLELAKKQMVGFARCMVKYNLNQSTESDEGKEKNKILRECLGEITIDNQHIRYAVYKAMEIYAQQHIKQLEQNLRDEIASAEYWMGKCKQLNPELFGLMKKRFKQFESVARTDEGQEYIICSAICNPEEKDVTGNPLIYCGLRHNNILWQSKLVSRNPYHQGFLTSKGRFVNRKEGLTIALDRNQILDRKEVRGDNLYSEDLY